MRFKEYLNEAYKIAKSPDDKLWYVLGSIGKNWMPISSGYKSKKDAEKYMKKQPLASRNAKELVRGI